MAVRVCLSKFCLQQFTQYLLLVPHSAVAIYILLLGCSVFSLTRETQHWYLGGATALPRLHYEI